MLQIYNTKILTNKGHGIKPVIQEEMVMVKQTKNHRIKPLLPFTDRIEIVTPNYLAKVVSRSFLYFFYLFPFLVYRLYKLSLTSHCLLIDFGYYNFSITNKYIFVFISLKITIQITHPIILTAMLNFLSSAFSVLTFEFLVLSLSIIIASLSSLIRALKSQTVITFASLFQNYYTLSFLQTVTTQTSQQQQHLMQDMYFLVVSFLHWQYCFQWLLIMVKFANLPCTTSILRSTQLSFRVIRQTMDRFHTTYTLVDNTHLQSRHTVRLEEVIAAMKYSVNVGPNEMCPSPF